MAFVIRKITQEDLDRIYRDLESSEILSVIDHPRSTWNNASLITGMRIGEDDEKNAYIWNVPLSRDDASFRYFVTVRGESVLIKLMPNETFLFPRGTGQSEQCRENIKEFTRAAFIAGGVLLQNDGEVDEWNRIVEVEFVDSQGCVQ